MTIRKILYFLAALLLVMSFMLLSGCLMRGHSVINDRWLTTYNPETGHLVSEDRSREARVVTPPGTKDGGILELNENHALAKTGSADPSLGGMSMITVVGLGLFLLGLLSLVTKWVGGAFGALARVFADVPLAASLLLMGGGVFLMWLPSSFTQHPGFWFAVAIGGIIAGAVYVWGWLDNRKRRLADPIPDQPPSA